MKFRYNYTGRENQILKSPYLEYETLFFSEKDQTWKKTKNRFDRDKGGFIHDIVIVDSERKSIQEIKNKIDFNFYEYEIDIDLLLKFPIKINCLRNFIIAYKTTVNYREYVSKIYNLPGLNKEDIKSEMNWYGGLDINLELGILFPDIFEKITTKGEKRDLKETFRFIVFDYLDINKILEHEIKNYNKIMNSKN